LYGPLENPLETGHGDAAVHLSPINLSSGARVETSPAWGVSLLLLTGGTTLVLGVLLLAAANLLLHPSAWRWGFAVATASEGLLTVGVALMATRLWRNSRRLNHQLAAVDHRLCEVQSTLTQSTLAQPSSRVTTNSLRTALRRLDSPIAMPR
jgi:hypothetical protein